MADFNNAVINGLLTSTGIANAYRTFAKTPSEIENLKQQAALRGAQTRYHDSQADENVRKAKLLDQVLRDPSAATDVARAYYAVSGKAPFTNANFKGGALNQLTGEQPVGNVDVWAAELEGMRENAALKRAQTDAAIARASQSRYSGGSRGGSTMSRSDVDTGGTLSSPASKMSAKQFENAQNKIQTVKILRMQLSNLKKERQKLGSFDQGIIAGYNPISEAGNNFDGAVDALRTTVRQLTRTPGEGSMSDWEGKLANAQLPSRTDFSSTLDQKIRQLEQLADVIERGYSDMLGGWRTDKEASYRGRAMQPSQGRQDYYVPEDPRYQGNPQTAGQAMQNQRGGMTLDVGTIDGGYRYIGGDPSLPSSWEEVR